MSRYKAYPEYKEVILSSIKVLPKQWSVKSLKHNLLKTIDNRGRTPEFGESGIPMLEIRNITEGLRNPTNNFEKFVKAEIVKEYERDKVLIGDVLISTVGATSGKVVIIENDPDYFIAQNVVGFRFNKNLSSRFMYYSLSSDYFLFSLKVINKGNTIDNLKVSTFINNQCFVPPYSEQIQIANFLDHETAKIDTLIEKQKQLIKLLKEKRQAVISHAVTKGLNPDAPMKDSGVEWLGEVPEHWEVKRLQLLFKIRKRIAGSLGYDVLSITQKGIKIKDINSGEGQLSMDYSKYQIVNKGDFAMNHMDLLTGFVDISSYNGVTSPDYRVFTLEDKNSRPEYYLYFMQMGYINKLFFPFGQGAAHIGRWRLPTDAFNEFCAPCPPESEQESISSFIQSNLEKMNYLEEKAQNAIGLLQERRIAIISAAVTGKIDVRDWKKPGVFS